MLNLSIDRRFINFIIVFEKIYTFIYLLLHCLCNFFIYLFFYFSDNNIDEFNDMI